MRKNLMVLAGVAAVAGLVGFGVGSQVNSEAEGLVWSGVAHTQLTNYEGRDLPGSVFIINMGERSTCVSQYFKDGDTARFLTRYSGPSGFQMIEASAPSNYEGVIESEELKKLCGHLISKSEVNTD